VYSPTDTPPHLISVLFHSPPTEEKDTMKRRSQQFRIRLQKIFHTETQKKWKSCSFFHFLEQCLFERCGNTSVMEESFYALQVHAFENFIWYWKHISSYSEITGFFLYWAYKNCSYLSLWGLRKHLKCAVL